MVVLSRSDPFPTECLDIQFNEWTYCCGTSEVLVCEVESIPTFALTIILIFIFWMRKRNALKR